ncbi:SUMO-specific isopeptidase USPL1 isoform X1 [Alligator sinensis]|uniref:SUMO-specific isopeptidase USPL1 isoform X1 n=2 Tax=Alligator sinensis TaxID=38654 RepID=A0A1U7S6C7_ALLSI|nr:SUMO-specific isopeptidase USPL1 isoform X1 [Alligator sinensis]
MMDSQKTGNGLQVIGQGTDIGISTLHMVGYLGKDYNFGSTTSDKYCPACKEKGQIRGLRTYRINFQESIFLCENPQCIYPLGYKPLDSIIMTCDSANHQTPGIRRKRKCFETSPITSPIRSCSKQARTTNLKDTEQTSDTDLVINYSGNNLYRTLIDASQDDQQTSDGTVETLEQKVGLEAAIAVSGSQESHIEVSNSRTQLLPNSELCPIKSEILFEDDKSALLVTPLCLQWRNVYALCWLNCILSALVHLEVLKIVVTRACTEEESVLQRLLTKYSKATALLENCQSSELKNVLPKAEMHLNEIRNTIFAQLQPQLKCELGKEESPVFALPLLLEKDPEVKKLFLHTFSWKFECLLCGYKQQDSCRKMLTTFTNIIPEWHPLNAVHIGPCNKCQDKSQRREMILEKIPSVFMLHFVEGLPHNNLKHYSFQFEGDFYEITVVVQYQNNQKHFVTWVLNPDETWLECDDLKGPYCNRCERFEVPPSEIHIVIWERKTSQVPNKRHPHKLSPQFQSKETEELSPHDEQSDSSSLHCDDHNAVDKIPTIHGNDGSVTAPATTEQNLARTEKKLLHGLEHLADDDIITLTLVEVQVDSEGNPLENEQMVKNNLVLETGTKQQLESSCLPKAPCTGDVTGGNQTPNTCTSSENASACLPIGELNPANIIPAVHTNHGSSSPEPSHFQWAEAEANPVNTENDIRLNSAVLKNKEPSLMENITQILSNMTNSHKIVEDSEVAAVSSLENSSKALCKNNKKSFVGSWVKKLLSKNATFMPSSASPHYNKKSSKHPSSLKVTDLNLPIKGASNFGGFQSKGTSKTVDLHLPNKEASNFSGFQDKDASKTVETPKSTLPHDRKFPSLAVNSPPSGTCLPVANFVSNEGTTLNKLGSSLSILNKMIQPSFNSRHDHSRNENHTSVETVKESDADKACRLRLKLLKKLNAKKKKLASLDKLVKAQMNSGNPPYTDGKDHSQFGSQNESEPLQNFLRELQYHIDVADNESVYSTSSNMSLCSSQSNTDVLAELLSPSTVASLEVSKDEEECRYLEMVDNNIATQISSEKINSMCVSVSSEDQNYYCPVKDSKYEDHITSLMSKSCSKKLSFGPIKEDIFEDLLTTSMLNSITGDIDLPHFDESLLEPC